MDGLLARGSTRKEAALSRLRGLLARVARSEISRRSGSLPFDCAELAGITDEAVAGALAEIVAAVGGYSARTPFTIWASKFVMSAVTAAIGSHLPRAGIPLQPLWDRPPQGLRLEGCERAEWDALVPALRHAIEADLSFHQRAVFIAVALSGVPADALAHELASNRNAVYKALFEARRVLRARLATGQDPHGSVSSLTGKEPPWLGGWLSAEAGDAGCDVTFQVLDVYAEALHQERAPGLRFPGVAAHLRGCTACRQDYEGLVAAAAELM